MSTVSFVTLGCKVNQTETETMAGLFDQRGYLVVDPGSFADIFVINTCSVTHLGERKSRQMIRRATRLNPDAVVAVTGCFAQISPEAAAAIEGVDVVVGTKDRDRIVDFVEETIRKKSPVLAVGDIMAVREFEDIPLRGASGRSRAFMKIQDGCDNYCSYCIIPYARGHLRSRPLDSIRSEVRYLADAGFREVVLTGINLGAYGKETGTCSLADAVRTILAESRIERIRLSSIESLEISEDLIELLEHEPRLCPHLHLPLQAGEDSILTAMRRPYTTGEYAALLERLRSRQPNIAVTTDIIVGFPGESPAIFQKGLKFAEAMEFAKIHVFPFSRRKGTPAATFGQQVDEGDKKLRVAELLKLSEQSGRRFRQRFVGSRAPVLVEQAKNGIAEGLTPNYQRVVFQSDAGNVAEKKLVEVELKSVTEEGYWGSLN